MTVQNVICTQGLSLIIVVLFVRYTDIETLFSFIIIIKKIIVCDRRYFEKPIDIVCWACMSSIQCGKVLCWPWSMIAYLTIQRFKGQIEKLCFSSTFSLNSRDLFLSLIDLLKSETNIQVYSSQVKGTSGLCVRFLKNVDGQGTQAIIKNLNLKKLKRF